MPCSPDEMTIAVPAASGAKLRGSAQQLGFGSLDLQSVVVDHADHYLLLGNRRSDCREIAGTGQSRFQIVIASASTSFSAASVGLVALNVPENSARAGLPQQVVAPILRSSAATL